jgi:hypothetical protein
VWGPVIAVASLIISLESGLEGLLASGHLVALWLGSVGAWGHRVWVPEVIRSGRDGGLWLPGWVVAFEGLCAVSVRGRRQRVVYKIVFHNVESGCGEFISVFGNFWIRKAVSCETGVVLGVFIFGVVGWDVTTVPWNGSVLWLAVAFIAVGLSVRSSPTLSLSPIVESRGLNIVCLILLSLLSVEIK